MYVAILSFNIGIQHRAYLRHVIIDYISSPADSKKRLVQIINSLKRTKIVEEKENYIYAEFTSAVFRFVDDVEFLVVEDKKIIYVRSASRIGRGDLGVNRKRIETIRKMFNKQQKKKNN